MLYTERMHRRKAIAMFMLPMAVPVLGSMATVGVADLWRQLSRYSKDPERAAADEDFWREIQRAFTQDPSILNLNNAGVSPSPRVVQEAMARDLARANSMPPPVVLWREVPARREALRKRLAATWGVDAEEVAITRNTTESLHICQHGFDFQPGDEVLTSNQDYPRMLNAFKQRERRHGVRLVEVSLPVPMDDPQEVVRRFEAAITERTRMILCSHMVNLTGQILPVKDLCALGRARGIPVIVDGAHALAHFEFHISELGCTAYGTSLHKWLFAPHGTGLLYVERASIEKLWPLFAENPGQEKDIRKFEEVGTHPAANFLAIDEAITLHELIGAGRKQARLVFLRDRWMDALEQNPRVRFNTNRAHACGIANFSIEGIEPLALASWLWNKHRVLVVAIEHAEFRGTRVSPSVYTTVEEVDRFVELVEYAMAHGLG